ncbi:hypothetical protein C8R31_106160 [Nitrosospira sp. Nsp2]|nr:hypothetical protein C8R31_106160 [Nitrosospira sp. Nsp2]
MEIDVVCLSSAFMQPVASSDSHLDCVPRRVRPGPGD